MIWSKDHVDPVWFCNHAMGFLDHPILVQKKAILMMLLLYQNIGWLLANDEICRKVSFIRNMLAIPNMDRTPKESWDYLWCASHSSSRVSLSCGTFYWALSHIVATFQRPDCLISKVVLTLLLLIEWFICSQVWFHVDGCCPITAAQHNSVSALHYWLCHCRLQL